MTVIPDSSVAHIMTQVDIVLVGAFAVVESGGILNQVCWEINFILIYYFVSLCSFSHYFQIGTYQMGIVAKALGKPFYCAAQSFKFTRSLYPLTQQDIPVEKPYKFGNPGIIQFISFYFSFSKEQ